MAQSTRSRRPHRGGSTSRPSRDLYQEVTDAMIAALERGTVPWAAGDGLQRNLVSSRPYRGSNQFVLSLRDFDSPWWLSFRQARALGGSVRRAERSAPVVSWKKLQLRDDERGDGEGVTRVVPLVRHHLVFNLEQCDAIAAPELERLPDFDPIAAAQALIDAMPRPPRIGHGGSRASYSPGFDRVRLPHPEAFDPPSAYYATAFHELGHATGHASRLARAEITEPGHAIGSPGYAREELVAELAAAMLCASVGIDSLTLDNSASYVAHWLQVLRADPKLVIVAGARAQRAADWIRDVRFEEVSDAGAATAALAASGDDRERPSLAA